MPSRARCPLAQRIVPYIRYKISAGGRRSGVARCPLKGARKSVMCPLRNIFIILGNERLTGRSIRMSDLMALTIPYLCLSALPRGQYRSSAIAQLALRLGDRTDAYMSTGSPKTTDLSRIIAS